MRENFDASAGVGHPQPPQRVKIIALNHQIAPRRGPVRHYRVYRASKEIRINRGVRLNIISLPDKPKLLLVSRFRNKLASWFFDKLSYWSGAGRP